MKLSVRVLAPCAAVALAAALSGCLAATAAGAGALAAAGTYAYERGELRTTIDAPLDDVYNAATTALEQLELPMTDHAKDAFSAHITATQAQGGNVSIDLTRESEDVTRVGVRVGTFGDESTSRVILQRIRDAL
jgi:hypothetical protein